MILAALLATATPAAVRVEAVAMQAELAGVVLVAKGDTVLLEHGYGTVRPDGGAPHRAGERWRLASITKQVAATLIVRSGAPLDRPDPHDRLTLRQLLTHHSGLANPDSLPGDGGFPSFYRGKAPDLGYCTSKAAQPGAAFSYNNCDYLIAWQRAGAGLRWPSGLTLAAPGERVVPGFVGGKPEPAFTLASFGAAGALTGTARDLLRFDRGLMTGKLLTASALAELWKPEGNGSYQALGQWVFPGQLKGCAAAKRIVQRDGEIAGVQTRNFILPDDDMVVIVFTNRSSEDFKLGEVWEGKGFVFDLLSAAVCPA